MSRPARAWEWFLEACSWVVVPLMVVGLVALVVIETRKQRRKTR
jgi:hypothetical protein